MIRLTWGCRVVVGLAVLLSTGAVRAQETIKARDVTVDSVPAAVKEQADKTEPGIKWSAAREETNDKEPGKTWYRLLGKKILRPAKETVTGDGDIDIVPEESRKIEVRVTAKGELAEIVTDVPIAELPKEVVGAIKDKNPLAPQYARSTRATAKGQPTDFEVWLDQRGFIRYRVSADGKKIEGLPAMPGRRSPR